jgi:DNA-binding CsgD family transcriptional regulator
MGFLRIIYWGVAYTTGIACATAFFLRYFFSRSRLDLKLALFLAAFGVSVICLSIREGFFADGRISSIAGQLALVGASLIMVTFPGYALGFDNVPRRRKVTFALKILGFAFALMNALRIFVKLPFWSLLYILTLSLLALTIFLSMSWISRGSVQWETKRKPFLMTSLSVFFALVLIFDFFRGLLYGLMPFLRSFDGGYVILPAFYAYLNIMLLYHHLTDWAKAAAESEKSGPEARAELVERYGISKRENDVLGLLRRGRTYLEMADELCVSLATIKSHVSHLYEKTGARNKVKLINLLYDSQVSAGIQPKSR